jgi:ketosteroid isomerase-like protein
MKKILYLIVSLLIVKNQFSQEFQGNLKTVLNNINAHELAWNKGDIQGFISFYWNHDSLMFIGKKGLTYGWKNTYDNYIKSYPTQEDMGKLTFQIIKMEEFNKSTVFVIGKWQLNKDTLTGSVTNKQVGGCFTLIWKKMNGKWFIVSDHTS